MKRFIKKELIKLSTGELASIVVLWLCYFIYFKKHSMVVIYPLSVLCLILFQGSIYWFICLARFMKKCLPLKATGKCYFVLKYIDLLLILGYILILRFSPSVPFMYYFCGTFIILFALIEFINYFLVRLSYPDVRVLFTQIKTRSLRKSKLAKEIEAYVFNKCC